MRVESMIKPIIVSLGCLISACTYPQSVGVYTEMSTHRVCCCNTVGLLTDQTNFDAAGSRSEFEKIYEGKANVIRVTSIEELNSCSVVFFGFIRLVAATSQNASLYPSYNNWLGTGSSAALNAELYNYVKNGGKVVAIGDSNNQNSATTASPFPQASMDTMNATLTACRNGVTSGLTILPDVLSANLSSCTQVNLNCSCAGTLINRYWVGKISVPSNDPDGEIFKTSDGGASENWISVYGVGHSSGGISLTATVSASYGPLTPNTCTASSRTLRPFAYEKVEKGYIMYLGDRNMFSWGSGTQFPPLTTCEVPNNVFPTNVDCFSGGPVAEYTGLHVFEVNKFFLWSLLKPCSSC